MSATLTPEISSHPMANLVPTAPPALQWATGTIHEILMQPGENFYLFGLRTTTNATLLLRIADPHTGTPIPGVTSMNVIYDLLKDAYLRLLNVQIGYRDFGPDAQAGINKLCIDRVILTQ